MSVKINVRLPDKLHARIKETALKGKTSISAVMIETLERGLNLNLVETKPELPAKVPVREAKKIFLCPRDNKELIPCREEQGFGWCSLCGRRWKTGVYIA